jgi:hypothetical protein
MKLFNKTIDTQLFKQYSIGSDLSKQKVVAKIFNPFGRGTWYIVNSDPSDPDYLWAIVDLGYGAEVGSVRRSDLENYRGRFGLGFERDLSFDPINAEELYNGLRQGEFYAEGGKIKLGDVVEVKEPNYGRDSKYYVVDDKAGYDESGFLISETRKREQGVFDEDDLYKLYAKGGLIKEHDFSFLRNHPEVNYKIEYKTPEKFVLSIQQKDNKKSYSEIVKSDDPNGTYVINSVIGTIESPSELGNARWYGEDYYSFKGILSFLNDRFLITKPIKKIQKTPTTIDEFVYTLKNYESLIKFAEFKGKTNFSIYFTSKNTNYVNTKLPSFKYHNVYSNLEPIYWTGIMLDLLGSENLGLNQLTEFGTTIGVKSRGNYGTENGFTALGDKYLVDLYLAKEFLDNKYWKEIVNRGGNGYYNYSKIDKNAITELEKNSRKNIKKLIGIIDKKLSENKEFQDYLEKYNVENVSSWNEEMCNDYLRENFGFRGVDGKGITKEANNRTLENLRKEVKSQMDYIKKNKLEYGGFMDDVYAKGGNVIDAFQIRTIKGEGIRPNEILTTEQEVKFKKGGKISESSSYIPTYEILKVHTKDGKVFENIYAETAVISGIYVSDKPLREKNPVGKNQMELFKKGGIPKSAIYIPRYNVDFIETENNGEIEGNYIYGGVWVDMKKQFRLVEEAKEQGRFNRKNEILKFEAIYKDKKISIDAKSLSEAKTKAIAQLKVPKTKVGLLSVYSVKDPMALMYDNGGSLDDFSLEKLQKKEIELAINGYQKYTEEKWKGYDYFSEKYAVNELAELELDLRRLNDGKISPIKIIGRGYKNPKKVAQEWLQSQIKKQKSIIETNGLSNKTNRSNFRHELVNAKRENIISEVKFNELLDESNEIIESLGETYSYGGFFDNGGALSDADRNTLIYVNQILRRAVINGDLNVDEANSGLAFEIAKEEVEEFIDDDMEEMGSSDFGYMYRNFIESYNEVKGSSFAGGGNIKGVKLDFTLETDGDYDDIYEEEVEKIKLLREVVDFDKVVGNIDTEFLIHNTVLKFYKNDVEIMTIYGDYNTDTDRLDSELDVLGHKYKINYHPTNSMGGFDSSLLKKELEKIDYKKSMGKKDWLSYVKDNISYFDLEDESEDFVTLTTRENGNVGDEEYGIEDVEEAKSIVKKIKEKYPKTKFKIYTVDEFVYLELEIPNEAENEFARGGSVGDKQVWEMSRKEYETIREKEKQLLSHAQRMKYQYTNIEKAKEKGATKLELKKWQEFSDFIKKYDTTFVYDSMIKYYLNEGKPLSKEVFKSIPDLKNRLLKSIEVGEVTDRIKSGKITKANAIKLIQNGGVEVPDSIKNYQEKTKSKSFRERRNEYLEKLGQKEADVWDKIGAESGSEIRGNEKMLKAYAEIVEEMLQKEGVGKGSFDQEDYDYFTDENSHLFNEFLVWNSYYEPEMTKTEKAWREKNYADPKSRNYVSNPKIISLSNDSKSKSSNYVPKAKIQKIILEKDGKEIVLESKDVLNGVNLYEGGGKLKNDHVYFAKRFVKEVITEDGDKLKPSNGYWVKKSALKSKIEPKSKSITTFKKQYKFEVGDIVWDKGNKSYGVVLNNFDNPIDGDRGEIRLDSDGRQTIFKTDKNYKEIGYNLVPYGSKEDTGDKKLNSLKNSAKRIIDMTNDKENKDFYIKTYSKLLKTREKQVGKKNSGSQKVKNDNKRVNGGSTKRGSSMQLAKQIRKEGESWQDALKRANEQLRNK